MLGIIEEAATAVMTYVEGLERDELLRSRLTRGEVRRQLLTIARTVAHLPPSTRDTLPEIDWAAWAMTGRQLEAGGAAEDDALWFAATSQVPATLMWLRVYRQQQPALFEFSLPGESKHQA